MKQLYIKITFTLLASTLFQFVNTPVHAQWQQLTGLQGEPAYWIRGTSNELFMVSSSGVLNSSNNGNLWDVVPDLYSTGSTSQVESISTSGDTIVAFSFQDSYISTDDGQTWTIITNPPTGSQINSMIIKDGLLYAATGGDYLYRSTNLGTNWIQVTTNFASDYIYSLATEGSSILACTDDGIYRSTNLGLTFTQVALPGVSVEKIFMSGNIAMAYSFSQGIYKSSDYGANWVAFQPSIFYSEVRDFCVSGNKIFAAAFDAMIVSDTGTANWSYVNYNQDITFSFSIHKKGNSVYAGTNRGVFSSADQGLTWTEMNNGIIPVLTMALTLLNDTLFVGSNIYGVSTYSGSGWEFSGLGLRNTNELITRGTDMYTASDFGIYKSTDSGNNWTLINNPLITSCSRVDVADSLIVGAANMNGVLRSGDFGATWAYQNSGITGSASCVAISGNNVIVGTYANGLYTSTDGGLTFTPTGAAGAYIYDLATIGNRVIAVSDITSGNFISSNNGVTWGPGWAPDIFQDVSTIGNLVLASGYDYIMLSMDSGMTFQNQTASPPNVHIYGSVASATDIYIGTEFDGVWKITLSEILSTSELADVKVSANLFPNVFRHESMIVIDEELVKDSPEFMITDVSGKIVRKILLNQGRTKLDPTGMNPGIYFYSVQTKSGHSKAGKFVIY